MFADWLCVQKPEAVITFTSQKQQLKGEIGKLVITDHAIIDIMEWYHNEYGMRTVVLRLPPVYGHGPYLANSGLGRMIECAKSGKPIEIWGDPNVGRDWIDIRDVVRAVQAFADSDAQGVFYITAGRLVLFDEAYFVKDVWGGEVVYKPEIPNGLIETFAYLNMSKTSKYWKPQYSFISCLQEIQRRMDGAI
jgi:UDP-glucose 4-epimerase